MLYIMTEYAECEYITPFKCYPVEETGLSYQITDDTGYMITVQTFQPSAHLDDIGTFKLLEQSS